MNEGQITGQRVEIRSKHPTYGHFGEFRPDTTERGVVVAYLARGAVVETEEGRVALIDYSLICIAGSPEQQARIADEEKRFGEWLHAKNCGPLCREHADPRDSGYDFVRLGEEQAVRS